MDDWRDAQEALEEEESRPGTPVPAEPVRFAPSPPPVKAPRPISVTLQTGISRSGRLMTLMPDGRWVPAPPLPFSRPPAIQIPRGVGRRLWLLLRLARRRASATATRTASAATARRSGWRLRTSPAGTRYPTTARAARTVRDATTARSRSTMARTRSNLSRDTCMYYKFSIPSRVPARSSSCAKRIHEGQAPQGVSPPPAK